VTTIETNFDTAAVLTVALSGTSDETVTVRYVTVDGTADSTDFVEDAGTLTLPPETTSVRLPLIIKGDALDEPDETFSVELSGAEHATIARARGTVTIQDTDPSLVFPVDATLQASWAVHRTYTQVRRLLVPGTIGKAFVYTIRAARQPRAKILCLPALATKPAPC
jgi:hypothetical protein